MNSGQTCSLHIRSAKPADVPFLALTRRLSSVLETELPLESMELRTRSFSPTDDAPGENPEASRVTCGKLEKHYAGETMQ